MSACHYRFYCPDRAMSSYKDTGEKSDESTSTANAAFSCETCGKTFNSRQELKEHSH
jgi:hypothetical protein